MRCNSVYCQLQILSHSFKHLFVHCFRFISNRSRIPWADPHVDRTVWQWRLPLDVLRLGRNILEGENAGIKVLPKLYLFGHSNLSFPLFCIMQYGISVSYNVTFMCLVVIKWMKRRYFRQYGKWGNEDFKLPWDEVEVEGWLVSTIQGRIK